MILRGWEYDSELCEWRNDDFSYPISVAPDIDGKFVATIWIEHPGVRTFRNGDPGYPPDLEDQGLGKFASLKEAMDAAEFEATKMADDEARAYAYMEALDDQNGGLDE
jgi:hypothetical protein